MCDDIVLLDPNDAFSLKIVKISLKHTQISHVVDNNGVRFTWVHSYFLFYRVYIGAYTSSC